MFGMCVWQLIEMLLKAHPMVRFLCCSNPATCRFLSPDGEDVRKTLACSDLSPGQVDELRELGQQCYSSCLRCLSLYTDVDVAQLLSSTLNSKQAQFSGDATEWHHLVETCAPHASRAWPLSVFELRAQFKHWACVLVSVHLLGITYG